MKIKKTQSTELQVIRKSNKLIEARYRLSVWEQRLILLLACEVSSDDEDFQDYELKVSDFAQRFGLNKCKAIYGEVEKACTELVGKRIELSTTEKKIFATWLSYAEYVEGSGAVKIRFDKSLKPYLLQLQGHFTQYPLSHVVNFKNQYSIRLYELLKMDAFKAKQGKFTRDFTYEQLRFFLAIGKDEYALFGHFKSRIIDAALKEINANTDLYIEEVRYGKTGRKVTDIMFVVKIRIADEIPVLQLEMEEPAKEEVHPVVERLISLGFAVEIAQRYKTKYGTKRIERNIAYTLAKQQEGAVKDIPAYLNMAIKEDMGGGWEVAKTKAVEEKSQQQTVSNQREKQAELAHLQKMAEMAGVPLEDLLPKKAKGGN